MAILSTADLGAAIADDFTKAAALANVHIPRSDIEVAFLPSPHRPPSSLPTGKLAVYVFMFGTTCLKVGKAGPNSVARYCTQHYGFNAPSTVAKSLLKRQGELGVSGITEQSAKDWICRYTARLDFLVPARYGVFALSLLEAFVQCRLSPMFEGFASQRLPSIPTPHTEARDIAASVGALGVRAVGRERNVSKSNK